MAAAAPLKRHQLMAAACAPWRQHQRRRKWHGGESAGGIEMTAMASAGSAASAGESGGLKSRENKLIGRRQAAASWRRHQQKSISGVKMLAARHQ